VKRYSGTVHKTTTERYFVDKFPMFFSSGSFSPPVVTFTFVDPGLGILDSFKTHLLAYGSLFEALSEVRLVYVSPRPTLFEAARKTFLATEGRPPKKDPGDEILRYFRLQKLWDERKHGSSQPTTWSSSISRQALRTSSVPETISKLATRHRIGRLRPLGNSRSGTTTQSDLRKRAGGRTD